MRSWLQLVLTSSPELAVSPDSAASIASNYINEQYSYQFFGFALLACGFASRHSFLFASAREKVHLSIDSPTLASLAARSSKTVFWIGLRAGFFYNRSRSEILSIRNRPFVASVFLRSHSIRHFFNTPPRAKVNNFMSTKLYVGNLSFNTTAQDLETMFAASGTVVSASLIEDRETGRSRGFAFVEMSSAEEAKAAITALDGKEVEGRNLKVNEAKAREAGGGSRY